MIPALRPSLVAALAAGVLAAGGCSSSPRCPPGAPCPPPPLPKVTFIPAVNGKSAVPGKDGHVPSYRVRLGEYLVMRVAVTVPRNTTVTALSLGISTSAIGGSPQHPSGMHPVLAHSRQPLATGSHTLGLRWRVPEGHPGASFLLVSVWSVSQADVAQPIATLALAQPDHR